MVLWEIQLQDQSQAESKCDSTPLYEFVYFTRLQDWICYSLSTSLSFSLTACDRTEILHKVKYPMMHLICSSGCSQACEMSNTLPKFQFCSFLCVNHWLNLHKPSPQTKKNRCGRCNYTIYTKSSPSLRVCCIMWLILAQIHTGT